jgi:hypothetical protein
MNTEHLEAWASWDDVSQHDLGGAIDIEKHDTSECRHDGMHITAIDSAGEHDESERCLAHLADDLHVTTVATVQSQTFETTALSKKRNDQHNGHSQDRQRLKRITGIDGKGLHGLLRESVALIQLELTEGTALV